MREEEKRRGKEESAGLRASTERATGVSPRLSPSVGGRNSFFLDCESGGLVPMAHLRVGHPDARRWRLVGLPSPCDERSRLCSLVTFTGVGNSVGCPAALAPLERRKTNSSEVKLAPRRRSPAPAARPASLVDPFRGELPG